ncbi:hypothetical protein D9M70_595070 [compost metagenome]
MLLDTDRRQFRADQLEEGHIVEAAYRYVERALQTALAQAFDGAKCETVVGAQDRRERLLRRQEGVDATPAFVLVETGGGDHEPLVVRKLHGGDTIAKGRKP